MMVLQKQYVLLHNALYEALSTENFTCTAADVESKLKEHLEHSGSESDIISAEYAVSFNWESCHLIRDSYISFNLKKQRKLQAHQTECAVEFSIWDLNMFA